MAKFIIIDNSIADTAGHHYQYAMFCLKAAKEMGYDPILATNKKNKDIKNIPWKVFPVYSGTFWEHEDYHSFLVNIYNRFEKSKYKIPLSFLLKIFGNLIVSKLLDFTKIKKFCMETNQLFDKLALSNDDIVFLPTSGLVEMLGISEFAKKKSKECKASWHFLFRRNIFIGSPEKYSFTYIKLRLYKIIFDKILKNQYLRALFYTDSDDLTQQYNMIESIKFQTLPIPHTIPAPSHKEMKNSLVISYLGDARAEKGYHHLPHIVQDLWSEYISQGKVAFVIQSNYNIPEGEPAAVVSRNQLQTMQSDKIKLVTEPPTLMEYQKILTDSHILLLPYDKTNYYARSSGILAEALAYGIPVLVPAGTWLSRQFLAEVYQYQLDLIRKLDVSKKFNKSELDFRYADATKADLNSKSLILDWEKSEIHCWLRMDHSADLLLVEIIFDKTNSSSAINVHVTQLTQDKFSIQENSHFLEKISNVEFVTSLIPLSKNVRKIWLGIKHPYTESVASISQINLYFLKENENYHKPPHSEIGTIYDDPEEISDKLKDMIENYAHYSKSTTEFSKKYYKIHNAKSLIKILVERSKSI